MGKISFKMATAIFELDFRFLWVPLSSILFLRPVIKTTNNNNQIKLALGPHFKVARPPETRFKKGQAAGEYPKTSKLLSKHEKRYKRSAA